MKEIKSKDSLLILYSKKNYGVNLDKIKKLCRNKGSNPQNIVLKLKKAHYSFILNSFSGTLLNKNLRAFIKTRLNFFWNIKLYRGIRHKLRLPGRGQRTHTNGRTKKKFKLF